jgi:ferritin
MLSQKMADALNEQMNKEMYSAYLYMSMSAYCDSQGLKGFAKWFMVQYHEEMFHAMKFFEYIQAQGGRVKLLQIDEPPRKWESVTDVFEKTLEHERFVTARINALMDLAVEQKDHATQIFLQWYVTEQVEEEENDNEILDQLRLVKNSPHGQLMLDRELGGRAATVPLDYSVGVSKGE